MRKASSWLKTTSLFVVFMLLCSCSFSQMHRLPPEDNWSVVDYRPGPELNRCNDSRALPSLDMFLGVTTLVDSVALGAAGKMVGGLFCGSSRRTPPPEVTPMPGTMPECIILQALTLMAELAGSLVFGASAYYGYGRAKECKAFTQMQALKHQRHEEIQNYPLFDAQVSAAKVRKPVHKIPLRLQPVLPDRLTTPDDSP